MKTKQIIILFIFFFFSLVSNSQTLQVLLFVDVKEAGREKDRYESFINTKEFFEEISQMTELSLNLQHYSYTDFTTHKVRESIDNLRVGTNDVIVFYYIGHGYNQNKDAWPTFSFRNGDFWMTDIIVLLKEKAQLEHSGGAKLLLVVGESCNAIRTDGNMPTIQQGPPDADKYKKLFTDFKGKKTIIMSSSEQGQQSWSSLSRGTYHGIAFRTAFREHTNVSSSNPGWNEILKETQRRTMQISGQEQKSQYKIIISSNPFN